MPVVAVFNSSEDTVEMLRLLFEHEGFQEEALEELVGKTGAFELLGKPTDLERVVEAVRNAASRSG